MDFRLRKVSLSNFDSVLRYVLLIVIETQNLGFPHLGWFVSEEKDDDIGSKSLFSQQTLYSKKTNKTREKRIEPGRKKHRKEAKDLNNNKKRG